VRPRPLYPIIALEPTTSHPTRLTLLSQPTLGFEAPQGMAACTLVYGAVYAEATSPPRASRDARPLRRSPNGLSIPAQAQVMPSGLWVHQARWEMGVSKAQVRHTTLELEISRPVPPALPAKYATGLRVLLVKPYPGHSTTGS
jgi:hypothetical protein